MMDRQRVGSISSLDPPGPLPSTKVGSYGSTSRKNGKYDSGMGALVSCLEFELPSSRAGCVLYCKRAAFPF
ncbi:hypothetical protein E1B28_005720 [Marasmius oreades]|uniref:Uncharacterized protein n=1 Tax=Marasmius oreades TaxID=181124 RepID=A0A9P7S3R4_9AGAR|nr:uncharacterized protein E1B28_005720 [Marasmius oreades]KAG7094914.1 hypothetical protein E1B28_005720 [Marasmius oreades]